jgi:hypothetical protein
MSGGAQALDVFELINLLVDKSLVVVEDSKNGDLRYRMLETLRAYALDQARIEGELEMLRRVHAMWWRDWLEPRAANPTSAAVDDVDAFYENLAAAFEWSISDPGPALRMLHNMAKLGQEIGRAADVVAAADRVLTPENAETYRQLWLDAAGGTSIRFDVCRSYEELMAFVDRMAQIAAVVGDDYHLALARFSDPTLRTRSCFASSRRAAANHS